MFEQNPIVNRSGMPFMSAQERSNLEAFSSNNTGAHRIHITRVIMRESGTYNNQYSRTFRADAKPWQMRTFTDNIAQNQSDQFSPTRLAGTLSGLLSLSAAPQSNTPIGIPNNWYSKRLIFVMYVSAIAATGGQTDYVLQGYTDYSGVNLFSKSIDPELVFYLNNVMEVRQELQRDRAGNAFQKQAVVSNFHVLSNAAGHFAPDSQLVRPTDVFSIAYTNTYTDYGSSALYLSSNALRAVPMASNRTNNLPSSFASTVLQSNMHSLNNAVDQSDYKSVMDGATNFAREEVLARNHFIRALMNFTSSSSLTQSFRFKDLQKLDPDVQSRIDFIQQGASQTTQQHQVGQSNEWNGARVEDVYAATLSQAFPALMMENLISSLSVSFTNKHQSGFYYLPESVTMFGNQPADTYISNMMMRLNREIMADLTDNNNQPYEATVSCSIYGETSISITIDQGFPHLVVTPSFCDGLTTPVVAYDKRTAADISSTMTELASLAVDSLPNGAPMSNNFISSGLPSNLTYGI